MKKYIRVWLQLTKNAFTSILSNRIDGVSYTLGKLVRFGFFLLLIQSIFIQRNDFLGYSKEETFLFFLTYNLVDVLGTAFFRGIYVFKHDISRGNFDTLLIKPINPLFYILSRLTDILDFIFLIPIVFLLIQTILHIGSTIPHIMLYILFVFVSMLIVLAIHVVTAALTIRNTESDNVIWLYRETMTLGRFPPEIFPPLVQFVFTFIIPIVVVVAFPTKILLGKLPPDIALTAIATGIVFFILSIQFWKKSIKKYSSASS